MSVPNNVSGASKFIIHTLNAASDAGWTVLTCGGRVIAPTALGAIGGWAVGYGASMGAFQGFTAGLLYSRVLTPVATFLKKHRGNGDDQIHPSTVDFLRLVGAVSEVAIPIVLTQKYGEVVLNRLAIALPTSIQWLAEPSSAENFTVVRGICSIVAPVIMQCYIESFRTIKQVERSL